MNDIPKISIYIYLDIPFSDDLLLEHIKSHMHFKVRKIPSVHLHVSFQINLSLLYTRKKFFNPLLLVK